MNVVVERLSLDEVLPLRLDVLRRDTPSRSADYAEDADPSVCHLGVRLDGLVVACSTWIVRPFPNAPTERAMQLKGMAVSRNLQGTGVGRAVLQAGIALARESACTIVWARARDSALNFYERNGMSTVGDGFIDETTALPHHLVVVRLTS